MMESAEKVRMVRCPNCQNILPELPDYSLYQCGGCGAVLHAKVEFQEARYVPERCDDDESVGAVGGSAEGRGVSLQDVEPGVGSLNSDQRSSEESIGYIEPSLGEAKERSGKGLEADAQNVNTPGISMEKTADLYSRLVAKTGLKRWNLSLGGKRVVPVISSVSRRGFIRLQFCCAVQ